MLQVEPHDRTRAKFPVVDIHTHFRHRFRGSAEELAAWVQLMDRNNIAVCVSLDGQWGELLDEHAKLLWSKHRTGLRFLPTSTGKAAARRMTPPRGIATAPISLGGWAASWLRPKSAARVA
jgi:hypothetical protein